MNAKKSDDVQFVMGEEVLQPSSLYAYDWPDANPELVFQPFRPLGPGDFELIRAAGRNVRWNRAAFEKNTAGLDVAGKVHYFLTHSRVNFNTVGVVQADPEIRRRIRERVAANLPIQMPYPLICKTGNWAKQLGAPGINAGEEATVIFFQWIDEKVREFYPPGVEVHIVSDATLYNTALQIPAPQVSCYLEEVRKVIARHGAGRAVFLHDYADLLRPFSDEYLAEYLTVYRTIRSAPGEVADTALRGSLKASIAASVNTLRHGRTYSEHRAVFGARAPAAREITRYRNWRQEVDDIAEAAFRDQIAIKMACSRLNVLERLWPGHIRATCHKGLKYGRAVIGLRCFPEYYGSSKLLPYHGMPVLRWKSGKPKMDIQPAVVLRGRTDLVRVETAAGYPYLFVAEKP